MYRNENLNDDFDRLEERDLVMVAEGQRLSQFVDESAKLSPERPNIRGQLVVVEGVHYLGRPFVDARHAEIPSLRRGQGIWSRHRSPSWRSA
jgi:hypothetical protein